MKGFKLNDKGDVVIDNDIHMVYDNELTRQTVETVLGTKCGEWFLNEEEGLNYDEILVKNPNYDLIQTEVQKGLLQVNETLWLSDYDTNLVNRHLTIDFTAETDDGKTIKMNYKF